MDINHCRMLIKLGATVLVEVEVRLPFTEIHWRKFLVVGNRIIRQGDNYPTIFLFEIRNLIFEDNYVGNLKLISCDINTGDINDYN